MKMWTKDDDEYLYLRTLNYVPLQQIARELQRNEFDVKERILMQALKESLQCGWKVHKLCEFYQISLDDLMAYKWYLENKPKNNYVPIRDVLNMWAEESK